MFLAMDFHQMQQYNMMMQQQYQQSHQPQQPQLQGEQHQQVQLTTSATDNRARTCFGIVEHVHSDAVVRFVSRLFVFQA